jgi:hypothetical protein
MKRGFFETVGFNHTVVRFLYPILKNPLRDGDKMAPSVEKKIAELEMGLLHLQQNIDIPEINLTIHPAVATQIKRGYEEGVRAKVDDFGDKVCLRFSSDKIRICKVCNLIHDGLKCVDLLYFSMQPPCALAWSPITYGIRQIRGLGACHKTSHLTSHLSY